jgi:tetratricopeptide (TPR) repeat protein
VLTSLAKIGELKVISRTSASQYRGTDGARNLRVIARELGVQNILEGSVRREGNRVLVNVQLIDATEDRHVWAEHYDRAITDSIGLQGELAAEIAAALRANVAPDEKARLAAKPTNDANAYLLYLKALEREGTANRSTADATAAEQLYTQAIAIDPKFALAYARASLLNSVIFYSSGKNQPGKLKARNQAEEALRLSPNLGEAHLALGLHLYSADKDYAASLREFSTAAAASPNNAEILQYMAWIYRRQGRWRESLANYQRAQDLDPRNRRIVSYAAFNCLLVRDWPAATATFNRALEIAPDSALDTIGLAYLEVFRNSSPSAAREILRKIPAGVDPDGKVTEANWDLAMLERDFNAAEKIVTAFPSQEFPRVGELPKTFYQGRIARARGDLQSAHRLFEASKPIVEAWKRDDPEDPQSHAFLGLLYAYLGRKEDAIREARQAVDLEPESKNAYHGAARTANLAQVYALLGESDQAINLIERLLSTPGPVQFPLFPENMTLADLRLRWEWDSLRGDPRYQKLIMGPEPKTNY